MAFSNQIQGSGLNNQQIRGVSKPAANVRAKGEFLPRIEEGDVLCDENMEAGNEVSVFRVQRGGIELSES